MRRGGTIQLARIFGIRIGVGTSWFVVLFFFIYILSGVFGDVLGSNTEGYLVAVASTFLFFVSLILHELGHAVVARGLGIEIDGIDLWFFGGLAKTRTDTTSPGDEFKIAVAGPLVTLVVILICVAAAAPTGLDRFYHAAALDTSVRSTPALVLLGFVATMNAFVLVLNLVPALPLDGGRIARAIAWRLTGDRVRATRAAAKSGQIFAMVLGGLGLLALSDGLVSTAIWALISAVFLYQAARGTLAQTILSERIRAIKVSDIMDREPVTIPSATTLVNAEEEFFLRYRQPWFAVVDETRHYVGLLRSERLEAELHGGRPALTAGEVSDDERPWRIGPGQTLEELLGSDGLRRLGGVVAVDPDGTLAGLVTLAQVHRALRPAGGV
ncbi:MAG TPA: site-2 protease family protein [Solirubrobacteraceae bacterium]